MSQNTLATKRKLNLNLGQYVYIIIFAALFLFYYIRSDGLTVSAITNILRHAAIAGILSYGMALIIITGDIDLSVGAIMCAVASFGCVFANYLTDKGVPVGLGILLTVLFCLVGGTLLGFFNGFMVGKAKLPAFIVTLATSLIFRSVAKYSATDDVTTKLLRGESANTYAMNRIETGDGIRELMSEFGKIRLFSDSMKLPILGIVFILIGIVLIYITTSTKYGKRLYAVGSNAKAAHMAGINVEWTRVSVFTIAGLLCGIAAALWLCDKGKIDPATAGVNNEMYAIAAVVLGGISMSGGKGRVIGVIFGALSYTLIDKIIIALEIKSTLINDSIKGLILLVAIMIQILGPQVKNLIASKKAKKA
ncbi:MAG: ABC transporter permease [Oscillospiraceae bacterium]|nr:ABC transporter permease [Oscillospiraceae bacterium]